MWTRPALRSDRVSESITQHDRPTVDYEHEQEHRFAEHE